MSSSCSPGLATIENASASLYVVTSIKGAITFFEDAVTEQELQRFDFDVGREVLPGANHKGLYRNGNRVALVFSDKTEMSEYLHEHGCNSVGYPKELLGWWFA